MMGSSLHARHLPGLRKTAVCDGLWAVGWSEHGHTRIITVMKEVQGWIASQHGTIAVVPAEAPARGQGSLWGFTSSTLMIRCCRQTKVLLRLSVSGLGQGAVAGTKPVEWGGMHPAAARRASWQSGHVHRFKEGSTDTRHLPRPPRLILCMNVILKIGKKDKDIFICQNPLFLFFFKNYFTFIYLF